MSGKRRDNTRGGNPYRPSLGDRFWRHVWLPGRRGAELEEDFHYAAMVGNLWRAAFLLTEKRVDIASGDDFALRWAARGGHTEMLALLFRHGGVDVNAKDGEPLIHAVEQGRHAAAVLLLEHGADAARQDFRALRIAHDKQDASMVAHILSVSSGAQAVVRGFLQDAQSENKDGGKVADAACLTLYRKYLEDSAPPNGENRKNTGRPPRP
jgi:ankyrin repeat protein